MAKVSWTTQSLDDIEGISQFISHDSVYYAQLFVENIFEKVKILETFPLTGRIVPEWDSESIREIIHRNYRIIYRLKYELVEILTIHHGAMILDTPKDYQSIK